MTSTMMVSFRDLWLRRITTSPWPSTQRKDWPYPTSSPAKPSPSYKLIVTWKLWSKRQPLISSELVTSLILPSVFHRLATSVADTSCLLFWDPKLQSLQLVKRTPMPHGTRIRVSSCLQRQSISRSRLIIGSWMEPQSPNSQQGWSSWSRIPTWCCCRCTEIYLN